MAKKTISLGDVNPFIFANRLEKKKADFQLEFGAASARIDTGNAVYLFGNRWEKKTFGLFQKTKAALTKHEKKNGLPEADQKKIKYIGIRPPAADWEVFSNPYALDISAAYHHAGKILGYFDDKIFNDFLTADKMSRLQAFGATAKHQQVIKYRAGQVVEITTNQSRLRPYFLNAAKYVGETLEEAARILGEDFYFFWVDCVFFNGTPENIEKIKEIFTRAGFKTHAEPCNYLVFRTYPDKYEIERGTDKGQKMYYFSRLEKRDKDQFLKRTLKKLKK